MPNQRLITSFYKNCVRISKKPALLTLLVLSGCGNQTNPLEGNSPKLTEEEEKKKMLREHIVKPPISIVEANKPSLGDSPNAKVIRTPSTDTQIRGVGVWNIKLSLKGDKVYRLNQFRDPNGLESFPELFGPDKDFEPFLSMESKGPGEIKITGRSFEEITIECGSSKEILEIYPVFRKDFLLSNITNQKEEIVITFERDGKKTLIDRFTLKWSNPRDVFVKDKNLNDIITLVETSPLNQTPSFKDARQWLIAATTGLNKYNIVLDPMKGDENYITIKTSKQMREKRRASIYDICVWLANKGIESGFEVEIIALPQHCILAISKLPTKSGILNTSNQYYVETEELIEKVATPMGINIYQDPSNINKKVDLALKKGEERISKEFKEGADKMFALKIKEWEKAYRHLK